MSQSPWTLEYKGYVATLATEGTFISGRVVGNPRVTFEGYDEASARREFHDVIDAWVEYLSLCEETGESPEINEPEEMPAPRR